MVSIRRESQEMFYKTKHFFQDIFCDLKNIFSQFVFLLCSDDENFTGMKQASKTYSDDEKMNVDDDDDDGGDVQHCEAEAEENGNENSDEEYEEEETNEDELNEYENP